MDNKTKVVDNKFDITYSDKNTDWETEITYKDSKIKQELGNRDHGLINVYICPFIASVLF